MSKRPKWTPVLLIALLAASVIPANAQAPQDDVAVSLLGSFSNSTSSVYTQQNPADQAGFLIEFRHLWNPLYGYEITYSLSRANQGYIDIGPRAPVCTPSGCPYLTDELVRAYAHEITADWVISLPLGKWRPFALAGGGVQIFEPAGGQVDTETDQKGTFVYGAGVDWAVLPHFGLRLQYRGNLYKAPDLDIFFAATGKLVHTAKPMVGIFYRF